MAELCSSVWLTTFSEFNYHTFTSTLAWDVWNNQNMNNLSIFFTCLTAHEDFMRPCCTSSSGSYTTGNDLGGLWGKNVTVIGIETHPLSCTGAAKPLWTKRNWKNCKMACSFSGQFAFLIHIISACITKICVFNPVKQPSHLSIKHQ